MNETASPVIFDRALKRRQILRARPHFARHDALFVESAAQIKDRLEAVTRDFPRALDLSPFPFLRQMAEMKISAADILFDEEFLPFAPQSFDLVASNLALHWVNDVPGCLAQIRNILKPGGLFIAALIGGDSLHELRACLMEAELNVAGGVSPRLSPTIDLQSAGALMQRAGFSLPVVDKEKVTLVYPHLFALMQELRGMGQGNAHLQRLRQPTRRTVFFEAAKIYAARYGDENGHIPASFELIQLHGWAPETAI